MFQVFVHEYRGTHMYETFKSLIETIFQKAVAYKKTLQVKLVSKSLMTLDNRLFHVLMGCFTLKWVLGFEITSCVSIKLQKYL